MRAGAPQRVTRICVAQIGAPHGVRGEVRLRSFTADPLAVARYGVLLSEDGTRTFELIALRPAKDAFIARLKGVDDRTAAEALTNQRLFVPRECLPEIGEAETYYHADLVGLAVTDAAGTVRATVRAVHDFGAGDVLELDPAGKGGGASVFVPFTTAVVPVVDIAGGRLVLAGPETWLTPEPTPNPAEPSAFPPQRRSRRSKHTG